MYKDKFSEHNVNKICTMLTSIILNIFFKLDKVPGVAREINKN